VLKKVDVGVFDVIKSAVDGDFDNTPYVGTIETDGVGIAPFHDFESKVPADLGAKLDELKAKLVSGEITVDSPAIP
jgi:basic membrane protein A